ncbi:alpha/beta fold hydrolase [Sphaerisporangium sp. TRM90804]|uniref:thioesterase II family protein n=1 Tax=Sphaerisporangium sp. TRM90804 TaxID=3031113 RepID=UPI00244B4C86|nr:alpha/beta fold hydrolase [Sphaerisporangium sp. TRM90804]MDH2423777.1 alpha/beta fold hydrolase [Sphaerisporangium sp. TRM90804]
MNRWIRRPPRGAQPKAQLVCFHYAGGGTSAFQRWTGKIPDWVDLRFVQLPGRENRFREPPFRTMPPLVRALADELATVLAPPFLLFGHSMGARVAFALTHELTARGLPLPELLVVSGTPAPSVTDWKHAHHLPEKELIQHLIDLGGVPPEVLDSPELLELMLPVIRCDLELSETSRLTYPKPLPGVPVLAIAGEEDVIAPPEKVQPWGKETSGPFEFVVLPGNHFFLHNMLDETLAPILRGLGRYR